MPRLFLVMQNYGHSERGPGGSLLGRTVVMRFCLAFVRLVSSRRSLPDKRAQGFRCHATEDRGSGSTYLGGNELEVLGLISRPEDVQESFV